MLKFPLYILVLLALAVLSGCPADKTETADSTEPAAEVEAPAVDVNADPLDPAASSASAAATVDPAAAGDPAAGASPFPAPDVKVTLADGTVKKLSDYRGKPLVVNFWAEWCGPCVEELPHFDESYKAAGGKFELIAFDHQMVRKDPVGFWKERGFSFPMALDDGSAVEAFGVGPIPHTFFIDKEGNVVDHIDRMMTKEEFDQRIAKLLSL